MMPSEIKSVDELPLLFSNQSGFAAAIKDFVGMFDREIYDILIFDGKYSAMVAGILADRMHKCVLDAKKLTDSTLAHKGNAIIVSDVLEKGDEQLELIKRVESFGCKVIRVGFIVEDGSFGARKSKILRKYPFEALITL